MIWKSEWVRKYWNNLDLSEKKCDVILSDRFITEKVGGEVDGVKPGEAGEEWGGWGRGRDGRRERVEATAGEAGTLWEFEILIFIRKQ